MDVVSPSHNGVSIMRLHTQYSLLAFLTAFSSMRFLHQTSGNGPLLPCEVPSLRRTRFKSIDPDGLCFYNSVCAASRWSVIPVEVARTSTPVKKWVLNGKMADLMGEPVSSNTFCTKFEGRSRLKSLWPWAAVAFLVLLTGGPGMAVAETYTSEANSRQAVLHLFGPGGPYRPMRECADIFSQRKGVQIQITAGTPPQWIAAARQKGDLIYEGAEFMLNDFMRSYPNIVDETSITGLYARAAGILVRKGNPKGIRKLEDLARNGIKIVVVTQENMQEVYERVAGIHYNSVMPVLTGLEAVEAWKSKPELDAWITYESWHAALKNDTDLIHLTPTEQVFRITPVAGARSSKHQQLSREFVSFLQSEEAHNVFRKWGWK